MWWNQWLNMIILWSCNIIFDYYSMYIPFTIVSFGTVSYIRCFICFHSHYMRFRYSLICSSFIKLILLSHGFVLVLLRVRLDYLLVQLWTHVFLIFSFYLLDYMMGVINQIILPAVVSFMFILLIYMIFWIHLCHVLIIG